VNPNFAGILMLHGRKGVIFDSFSSAEHGSSVKIRARGAIHRSVGVAHQRMPGNPPGKGKLVPWTISITLRPGRNRRQARAGVPRYGHAAHGHAEAGGLGTACGARPDGGGAGPLSVCPGSCDTTVTTYAAT
jgi:hypothetical protein